MASAHKVTASENFSLLQKTTGQMLINVKVGEYRTLQNLTYGNIYNLAKHDIREYIDNRLAEKEKALIVNKC